MSYVEEPSRRVPVVAEADVCVLGGSCTGVFAAVRAARLGARVVLVEMQNGFGGTATGGLVNVWHRRLDTDGERRIIAGLTEEVIGRLEGRGGAEHRGDELVGVYLNPAELKIELDELVREHGVRPMLLTRFCAPWMDGEGVVRAAIVENKDGRGAVKARVFVDATGDGDLAARLDVPFELGPGLQPPTTCALIRDLHPEGADLGELMRRHGAEFGLEPDAGWSGRLPRAADVAMCAETHVFGVDAADAEQLTRAEMEGRRKVRALVDLVHRYAPGADRPVLLALPSHIGVRETRRFESDYRLTEADVLSGRQFADAVANGSYRVDVHNLERGGFTLRYLDGREVRIDADGRTVGRWREERAQDPTFYQVPYRSMVSSRLPNVILAGRMIGTDRGAFGAVRVMVNLNQVGEAAGVAAALAAQSGCAVSELDPAELRTALADGGSIVI